jgi:phage-related protein
LALQVLFYRTAAGAEPARDWLRSLDEEDRKAIGNDLRTLQIGWPVGMPLARSLGDGLWELRSKLSNRIARLVFFFDGDRIIILSGFIKKSQSTPKQELDTARSRKADHDRNPR